MRGESRKQCGGDLFGMFKKQSSALLNNKTIVAERDKLEDLVLKLRDHELRTSFGTLPKAEAKALKKAVSDKLKLIQDSERNMYRGKIKTTLDGTKQKIKTDLNNARARVKSLRNTKPELFSEAFTLKQKAASNRLSKLEKNHFAIGKDGYLHRKKDDYNSMQHTELYPMTRPNEYELSQPPSSTLYPEHIITNNKEYSHMLGTGKHIEQPHNYEPIPNHRQYEQVTGGSRKTKKKSRK